VSTGISGSDTGSCVSLNLMNRHIAAALAGVFLPVDAGASETSQSIGSEPWDALRTICPMPSLKFASVDSVGFDHERPWDELCSRLLGPNVERPDAASLATLVVARGVDASDRSFVSTIRRMEERVKRHSVPWNPFPVNFWSAQRRDAGWFKTND